MRRRGGGMRVGLADDAQRGVFHEFVASTLEIIDRQRRDVDEPLAVRRARRTRQDRRAGDVHMQRLAQVLAHRRGRVEDQFASPADVAGHDRVGKIPLHLRDVGRLQARVRPHLPHHGADVRPLLRQPRRNAAADKAAATGDQNRNAHQIHHVHTPQPAAQDKPDDLPATHANHAKTDALGISAHGSMDRFRAFRVFRGQIPAGPGPDFRGD